MQYKAAELNDFIIIKSTLSVKYRDNEFISECMVWMSKYLTKNLRVSKDRKWVVSLEMERGIWTGSLLSEWICMHQLVLQDVRHMQHVVLSSTLLVFFLWVQEEGWCTATTFLPLLSKETVHMHKYTELVKHYGSSVLTSIKVSLTFIIITCWRIIKSQGYFICP